MNHSKFRCKATQKVAFFIDFYTREMVALDIRKAGEKMEEKKLIYQKNADKQMNRVIIPRFFIEKHGRQFFMEIYEDKIILKPIKGGE